jgi:perosamine synthetase
MFKNASSRSRPISRGRFSHTINDDVKSLVSLLLPKDPHARNRFEIEFAKYNEREYCVTFSMARVALFFALKAMGAKENQKIIMPPITIKAMLDIVLDLKLKPIFVDLNSESAFYDEDQLRAICKRERPEFCLVTYLFGAAPNQHNHFAILRSYGVRIIEDFSQGLNLGLKSPWSGRKGEVSIYSSSAVKQLDTYGGGLAVTDNKEIYEELSRAANSLPQPSKVLLVKKISISLLKNVMTRGLVFRFTLYPILRGTQAIGISFLDRFVGNRSQSPIDKLPKSWFYAFSDYQGKFGEKFLPRVINSDLRRGKYALEVMKNCNTNKFISGSEISSSVFWQLILISENPSLLRRALLLHGIDSAFSSLILLTKLKEYGIDVNTPVAQSIYQNGVYLPCYSDLNYDDARRISTIINKCE